MKRFSIHFFLVLAISATMIFANGKTQENQQNSPSNIHSLIQKNTARIFDSLVQIRRQLHQYPELSGKEKETAKKIKDYLIDLGLEVKTDIGGYSVVGILRSKNSGKIIAWRADIDAFANTFPDVVDFRSKVEGVRHICGHDVHATIGMGIANVLSSVKDSLNGTIVFIFQPAEENATGAKRMIADGLYKIAKPDEIYALHINPLQVGFVTTKSNELYAYEKVLSINFRGVVKKDTLVNYMKSLLRRCSTVDKRIWDFRNLGDPNIGISSPASIYRNYLAIEDRLDIRDKDDEVTIKASLYGTDKNQLDLLPSKLKEAIQVSEFAQNLAAIDYTEKYPTVYNDPDLTEKSSKAIVSIYGQNSFIPSFGVVPGFNDDFAYFQQDLPGVYFGLGGSNYEKGIVSMPHTPNFAVDEECIAIGVKYFSSMIVERMKNE